jgi:predicted transcriptional regulator
MARARILFDIDINTLEELNRLAAIERRPRNLVLKDAVDQYARVQFLFLPRWLF